MLSPYHPMQLALGLIVWSLWFVVNYASLSVACSLASFPAQGGPAWINRALLLFALLTTGLLLNWALRCWRATRAAAAIERAPQRLIAQVAAGIHLTAAVATFAVGLVTLALPPCI